MQSDDADEAQDAFPFVEGYLLELNAQGSQVVPLRRPGWREACLQCLYTHTRTRTPTTLTRMDDECVCSVYKYTVIFHATWKSGAAASEC